MRDICWARFFRTRATMQNCSILLSGSAGWASRVARSLRPALMGRGMCRLNLKENRMPALTDLHDLTTQLLDRPGPGHRVQTGSDCLALGQAATVLSSSGNYRGAIEMLDCEQQLGNLTHHRRFLVGCLQYMSGVRINLNGSWTTRMPLQRRCGAGRRFVNC